MIQELLSLEEGKTLEFKENARSLPGILHDQLPYAQAKANALDWDALQEAFAQVDKKITESKAEDLELLVKHANKVSPSYGGIILFGLNRLRACLKTKFS